MKRDLIERLRAANPVPHCTAPSFENLRRRLDTGGGANDALVPGRRARPRGWLGRGLVAAPSLVGAAVVIAVVVIALTVVGRRGHAPTHPGPPPPANFARADPRRTPGDQERPGLPSAANQPRTLGQLWIAQPGGAFIPRRSSPAAHRC